MTLCPSCGAQRVGAERFCPACGLDYWRAAAAVNAPAVAVELAPAAAVAVPRGGGVSGILVAVGLLLLVGAGAVAAIMIMGGGGTAPDLRAGAPAPVYTAEREIVNAFFREARDPDASFVVSVEGTVSMPAPNETEMDIVSTIDVHGTDYMGDMTVSGVPGVPEPITMSVAMVDGVGYALIPGATDWMTDGADSSTLGPINPFSAIATVSEVEYVGRETSGSTTLHHLLVTKWLGANGFDSALAGARMGDRENTFHIWVTPEGVPTRATYDATIDAEIRGGGFTVNGEMEYTFSNWGEVEPILAPI